MLNNEFTHIKLQNVLLITPTIKILFFFNRIDVDFSFRQLKFPLTNFEIVLDFD